MDIASIRPRRSKVSDKFSWNLYAYLRKYGIDNHRILYDNTKPFHPMNIYVMNGTVGSSLWGIMRDARKTRYSLSLYPLETYTDITESFWKQYLSLGRCMFDAKHDVWWLCHDPRFTEINSNSKRCNWCGKYLRRNIVKQVTIKRIERWDVQQ